MNRPWKLQRLRRPRGLIAIAAAALALNTVACGPRVTDDNLRSELAQLRKEHEAIQEQLALLRSELSARVDPSGAAVVEEAEAREPEPVVEHPFTPLVRRRSGSAIPEVLDAYARALEAEDIDILRDEIYGGDVPADDMEFLNLWFDRTEELQVDLVAQSIDISDERAKATVLQTSTFRLSRTYERRTVHMQLRMVFERRDGDWRLRQVQARL